MLFSLWKLTWYEVHHAWVHSYKWNEIVCRIDGAEGRVEIHLLTFNAMDTVLNYRSIHYCVVCWHIVDGNTTACELTIDLWTMYTSNSLQDHCYLHTALLGSCAETLWFDALFLQSNLEISMILTPNLLISKNSLFETWNDANATKNRWCNDSSSCAGSPLVCSSSEVSSFPLLWGLAMAVHNFLNSATSLMRISCVWA